MKKIGWFNIIIGIVSSLFSIGLLIPGLGLLSTPFWDFWAEDYNYFKAVAVIFAELPNVGIEYIIPFIVLCVVLPIIHMMMGIWIAVVGIIINKNNRRLEK